MHEIQRQYSKQQAVIREYNVLQKNKGLASLDLSDGTLFGHITGKSIMHVMLLMGIKVYLYGRVLLIDILDYTIDQLIQTTLDASELCTVTTSCLRLVGKDSQDML
ncbi:hypothetical protein EDC96DRAFT_545529 [Choanephora cucurbitarum]|nr:hypothetical protein EDC96DRAFT_545529 [Choanephora cucurbitarum]